MSTPVVLKQSVVSSSSTIVNLAITFELTHLQRYKKRLENEIIFPKNCRKSSVSAANSPPKNKNSNTKPVKGTRGVQQRKKSIRKEILDDFKRIYGNPAVLNSRSKTVKRQHIKQEPIKKCSLESVIYVGTVYKFKGYTVTNTIPPMIDLTTSDLDLGRKSAGSYSLNTVKSTVLNSLSSHTMYPSIENVSISTDISDKRSVSGLCNSYSADAINIKRIPKQSSPYVISPDNNRSNQNEDLDLLDLIINMEQEYRTDDALRYVDIKENIASSDTLDDLNDINKCSLVSDLNLNLKKLTQLYDVNAGVKN